MNTQENLQCLEWFIQNNPDLPDKDVSGRRSKTSVSVWYRQFKEIGSFSPKRGTKLPYVFDEYVKSKSDKSAHSPGKSTKLRNLRPI
jgi:hypothetical protein